MKRIITAAAISVLLFAAGCSSDNEPDPQTPPTVVEFDGGILSNAGFDNGSEGWSGNAANPVDDGTGTNTVNYANVEAAGNAYDVNLSHAIAIEQGKTYKLTFKAKSNVDRTMVAGIGLNQDPWTNKTETVNLTSEWVTHTLTLAASDFGNENSRVLFDMGAEVGEVYIDDVSLEETAAVAAPFDSGLLNNGDFLNGVESWTGNAANPQDDGSGSNNINYANIEAAGNPWDVNLSQAVAIEQGKSYALTFKAKSNVDRELVAGIGLNEDPWTSKTEIINLTSEWQTFTSTLTASDFGNANSRVLFDMGGAAGEVLIDDVSLVETATPFDSGLLSNGDFSNDNADWLAGVENATDPATVIEVDGNKIYSVEVMAAGNSYDVNLSQKLAIESGKTYKLNFKARSDTDRNITAGIGLSGDPWTNQVDEAVILNTEWQDYERTFTANFEAADSRVIFDMGAEMGLVQIDDVSLVEVVSDTVSLPTLDFESTGAGADFAWEVFENNDNPAVEVVANPSAMAPNASATVAKITARAASSGAQPWAGAVTENLPTFTLDSTNKVVKVMVYKTVISDVGIKLESLQADGGKASTGEIKVANSVVNQWEELSFDFSSVIGQPANSNITGLVIFPDFNTDGRAADTVTYFDGISFNE